MLGRGFHQSVEMPSSCTVSSRFPNFVSCHPCWDEILVICLSFLSLIQASVSNPIKLTGSLSWTLVVSLFWCVVDSLCEVSSHLFTPSQGQGNKRNADIGRLAHLKCSVYVSWTITRSSTWGSSCLGQSLYSHTTFSTILHRVNQS